MLDLQDMRKFHQIKPVSKSRRFLDVLLVFVVLIHVCCRAMTQVLLCDPAGEPQQPSVPVHGGRGPVSDAVSLSPTRRGRSALAAPPGPARGPVGARGHLQRSG